MFGIQPKEILIPAISIFLTGIVVFFVQLFTQRYLSKRDRISDSKRKKFEELGELLYRFHKSCADYIREYCSSVDGDSTSVRYQAMVEAMLDLERCFGANKPFLVDIEPYIIKIFSSYEKLIEVIDEMKGCDEDEDLAEQYTCKLTLSCDRLKTQSELAIQQCLLHANY